MHLRAYYTELDPTAEQRRALAQHVAGARTAYNFTWAESRIAKSSVTAREGSAAMAMASLRSERSAHVVGFCGAMVPLALSERQRLDDVVRIIEQTTASRTNCAQPMLYALENKLEVDCFSIYTDNETRFGSVHPFQALKMYREHTGIPAKLVVAGMTSTSFTIADPSDAGMLDVVGFDAAAPAVIADFAADREVLQ